MLKNLALAVSMTLALTSATHAKNPVAAYKSSLAQTSLLTDIELVSDKIIAVGERGHIIYSTDGKDWHQANVPVNVLLTSISFKDADTGFAVGHDATILKSTDGGINWQKVNFQPELDKPFLSIKSFGDTVIAAGAYGLYWESKDGGNTWSDQFQDELLIEDDRLYLEDLKQFEPDVYEQEKQFMLPHFNNVSMVEDVLYLAGEAGFIAQSFDLGENWIQLDSDYFGSYFSVTDFKGQVLLAGLRGNLYSSDDKGQSWQQVETPVKATINTTITEQSSVFHFANSGNLFYSINGEKLKNHVFDDGKAIMSGVVWQDTLFLATEAGIKSISLLELSKK